MGGRSCVVTEARQASRQRSAGSGPPDPSDSNHRIDVPRIPRAREVGARVRVDDAEVLADHHGAGALRLEGEDADHRLVVVVDVGALGRVGALRHPPEPEQPDHVVDADAAGVPEHRAEQVAERRVAASPRAGRGATAAGSSSGRAGCTGPAARRLRCRGRTRPASRHASAPPGCTPTARSCMVPSAMPASTARPCARSSCSSSSHCSHSVKPISSACAAANAATPGLAGSRSSAGQVRASLPCSSASTLHVANSRAAPARRGAGTSGSRPRGPAVRGTRARMRRAARFAVPGGVPVDHVRVVEARVHLVGELRDDAAVRVGQVRVLGHGLDPQVDRGEEPARARQVRRRLERRDRLLGVQRVHEHEVGAEAAARPDGQVGEVAEVADAPGARRAHAVELRRERPSRAGRDARGARAAAGVTISGRRRGALAGPGGEPVVADRQVRRAARTSPRRSSAPSTSRGSTQCSTCSSRRSPPLSSRTTSSAGSPWGTCIHTQRASPAVATTQGGSIRRHGASQCSWRARTGSLVSTSIAASTRRTVSAETSTVRPRQSVNDVETPWAWASSASSGGSGVVTGRSWPTRSGPARGSSADRRQGV